MHGERAHGWLGVAALVSGLACTGTVPEPPNFAPPELARIEATPASGSTGDTITLVGAPSAAPAGVRVHAVNLDTFEPSRAVTADEEGGFTLILAGQAGDEIRLQLRTDTERSVPLDLVARIDAPPVTAPRPLEDCLAVEPAVGVDIGDVAVAGAPATGRVTVRNDCGADVRVATIDPRRPDGPISLVTDAPVVVPAGDLRDVEFQVAPTEPGAVDAILFLTLDAPETGRRPVTVLGTAN